MGDLSPTLRGDTVFTDGKDTTMAADTPNEALCQLLASVSWSGERLAREICRVLGTGAVHPTAPYKWLKGHQPRRDEVRQATAFVLSQASSQLITVSELWPGCAAHDSRLIPATVGMEVPWTLAGTLAIAHDWLLGGLMIVACSWRWAAQP